MRALSIYRAFYARRTRDWSQINGQLKRPEYIDLIPKLRPPPDWNSWNNGIGLVCEDGPVAEGLLRSIFQTYRSDNDPRWQSVLLAAFWKKLLSIHSRKYWWDQDDPDGFWQTICLCFLQTIISLDIRGRKDRLGMRVLWGTYHRLYEECLKEWNRQEREESTDPSDFKPWADPRNPFAEHRTREVLRVLERYQDIGLITPTDLDLLAGTLIYGESLKFCAKRNSLSYEAAKKRRQRGLVKIHIYEHKTEESMSPFSD